VVPDRNGAKSILTGMHRPRAEPELAKRLAMYAIAQPARLTRLNCYVAAASF
jgi:hypothetical protein